MEDAVAVSMLNNYIKQIFDSETFLYNIRVYGEVSEFKVSNDIAYITLKDKDAMLPCVLFDCSSCYKAKIGEKVVITGTPRFYVKGGKLSFNANKIEPFGEGEILKKFLELKKRLEAEGLFAESRKKHFPQEVKRIGIVTSGTGAVIEDFKRIAKRRNNTIDFVLFPVKVQGFNAEREIANGINYFSGSNVDAVIVGRGGGSEEDLSAFNTEIVVRAISNCSKFTVSAIGHETNKPLSDFVADMRVATMSEGAEMLAKESKNYSEQAYNLLKQIYNLVNAQINAENSNIGYKMDKINYQITNVINLAENKLLNLAMLLDKSNPLKQLTNGYSKVFLNNELVTEINQVKTDNEVSVELKNGKFTAKVLEVKKYDF